MGRHANRDCAEKARLERALRILSRPGGRLWRGGDGCFRLSANGDRRKRPQMTLSFSEFEALRAQGVLVAALNADEWRAATGTLASMPAPKPCGSGRKAKALSHSYLDEPAGRNAPASGFARLAHLAAAGEGPLTLRSVRAGRRLMADAEASRAAVHVTMNWDRLGTTRARNAPVGATVSILAREAQRRLDAVRDFAGADVFNLAVAACVRGQSLAALECAFGLSGRSGGAELGRALARLADAYDIAAPPERMDRN